MGLHVRLVTSDRHELAICDPASALRRLVLEEAVGGIDLPVASRASVYPNDPATALADVLGKSGFEVSLTLRDWGTSVAIHGWHDDYKLCREWPAVWSALSEGVAEYARFVFCSDEGHLWVEHVAPMKSWRTAHDLGEWGRMPGRLVDRFAVGGEPPC